MLICPSIVCRQHTDLCEGGYSNNSFWTKKKEWGGELSSHYHVMIGNIISSWRKGYRFCMQLCYKSMSFCYEDKSKRHKSVINYDKWNFLWFMSFYTFSYPEFMQNILFKMICLVIQIIISIWDIFISTVHLPVCI